MNLLKLTLALVLVLVVSSSLGADLSDPLIQRDLKLLSSFYDNAKVEAKKPMATTIECALCGVVINEIEGFLSENISQAEIVKHLQDDVCAPLGGEAEVACDLLVDLVPLLIDAIDNPNSVSTVCVDVGMCEIPFPNGHPDMVPIPRFTVSLDVAPVDRWTHICSLPLYQQSTQYLYQSIISILPDGGKSLELLGEELNLHYFPTDYAAEIRGCANALGVPYGWASLFQLGYEVSDACTSIISQDEDGSIWHSRNMDFGLGMGFSQTLRDMTIQLDFTKGGKTVFTSTTFVGYMGILSGMKPYGYSVTIDSRYYPDGIGELFYEIIAAIKEKNASLVSFLSRRTFEDVQDWPNAIYALSNGVLIADVYYITAGVSAGQGAVISRNRTDAANVWRLDAPTYWFNVETNYDHWNQPPWFDNRRDPAIAHMTALGRRNLNSANLFGVMTQKPTLNLQTVYSLVAHPATGDYKTFSRYCKYPCVQ